ncbi:MAG: nitroreductase family protein [Anaerolineae bacterium]
MDVQQAIAERRAYRSLEPVAITEALIESLGEAVSLSPSCFNNQPWRFVFAYDPQVLKQVWSALSKGNAWMQTASLIVAVFSKKELDCVVRGREYYLFDLGMGTAFLILRATELGLVAHPTAGYDEDRIKEVLGIPEEMTVITLVAVGKHSESISPLLSEKQVGWEKARPKRLPLDTIVFRNRYRGE